MLVLLQQLTAMAQSSVGLNWQALRNDGIEGALSCESAPGQNVGTWFIWLRNDTTTQYDVTFTMTKPHESIYLDPGQTIYDSYPTKASCSKVPHFKFEYRPMPVDSPYYTVVETDGTKIKFKDKGGMSFATALAYGLSGTVPPTYIPPTSTDSSISTSSTEPTTDGNSGFSPLTNECAKYQVQRAVNCNSRDAAQVQAINICQRPMAIQVCIQTASGCWVCGSSVKVNQGSVLGGTRVYDMSNSVLQYQCHSTGRFVVEATPSTEILPRFQEPTPTCQ